MQSVSKKRVEERHKAVLEKVFGLDHGKIKPFLEKDHNENHDL